MLMSLIHLIFCLFCSPTLAADKNTESPAIYALTPIELLKEGNRRFVSGKLSKAYHVASDNKNLVKGQNPHSLILSCSDSRTAPEIVFDQGMGDLFTIRVAGNVVSPDVVASIEYAITHFGIHHIIVMGHESCGAVKAAMEHSSVGHDAHSSKALEVLIGKIKPALGKTKAHSNDQGYLARHEAILNVQHSLAVLLKESVHVAEMVHKKKLIMLGAVYSIETGEVEFLK